MLSRPPWTYEAVVAYMKSHESWLRDLTDGGYIPKIRRVTGQGKAKAERAAAMNELRYAWAARP